MREAVAQLSPGPDHLLVDAVRVTGSAADQIIHGDALSIQLPRLPSSPRSIATNDPPMAPVYPEYDLASNKATARQNTGRPQ